MGEYKKMFEETMRLKTKITELEQKLERCREVVDKHTDESPPKPVSVILGNIKKEMGWV